MLSAYACGSPLHLLNQRRLQSIAVLLSPLAASVAFVNNPLPNTCASFGSMANPEFYGLSTTTLQGQPFPFKDLEGKAVLIVNVASKCGFTPQYKGLEELHQQYKDRGLVILGFPCNQFGGQEPGDASAIGEFCQRNFGVTFPIMEKSDVNGNDANPVFKYLKSQKKQFMMEMIKWNFEKFLVDKTGQVVARFSSMATPASLAPEIEKVLNA